MNDPSAAASLLLNLLNPALAKMLALDPAMASKLAALDGRRVRMRFGEQENRQFVLELRAQPEPAMVISAANPEDAAFDLDIKSKPSALLQMALERISASPTKQVSAGIGRLHISGDAELARLLQQLAESFDPDWERPFTDVFGDVLGFQLARGARRGVEFLKQRAAQFAEASRDYLLDESKTVLSRGELEQFFDEVDNLRDASERIEIRVRRLRLNAQSRTTG